MPDDAAATFAYRRVESVAEWLTRHPTDADEHQETFTQPQRLADTVMVELGGLVIGDLMFRVEDGWAQDEIRDRAHGSQIELGWVLDPAYVGNGYATEAVRALLQYAFTNLGARRVVADCFLANESSWRLMERLGMRRETHAAKESLHRSGRWLDSLGYALLADEWAAMP